MDIEVKNKKENPQLQRQEITGEIKFSGATPSNQQLRDELAKKIGVQADLVAIRHIYGAFGTGKASFEAVAYATKEQFAKIEPKKKEKKAAATPAPAAPTK